MPRGSFRTPMFECPDNQVYFTAGTSPSRNSKGLVDVYRQLDDMPLQKELVDELFKKVEHAAKAFIDSQSLCAISFVKGLSGYDGFQYINGKESSIWSAVAWLENGYLNEHDDKDYFLGAIMIVTREDMQVQSEPRQFFCFPRKNCAVCLRNGDILLFNPRELHCLSTRVCVDVDCIALSFYLKTAVVGGNDNSRSVENLKV